MKPFLRLLLVLLLPAAGHAADPAGAARPLLSEFRLGSQLHDPWSPERGSADIAFQFLLARPFEAPAGWTAAIPRPTLGGALNPAGKTSHLHAGLTWTLDITPAFFVEASIGGAVHDGDSGRTKRPGHNALGCRAHFREALGIGYRLDRNWSVTASLEHLSNAGFCRHNRGLTNLGLMVGYRF